MIPTEQARECPSCLRSLPLTAWHADRRQPSGRRGGACRRCRNSARRKLGGRGPVVRVAPDATEQTCTGCGRTRPAGEFTATGHRCASCRATTSRRWWHRRRAALRAAA